MARPSEYAQDKADIICERLALGESLRKICADEGMPRLPTVFRWINANEEFRNQYARAREEQAEAMVDELIEIADNADEDPQRSRLRLDARKWAASKLKPKKYGEKLAVGGADDLPAIQSKALIEVSFVGNKG